MAESTLEAPPLGESAAREPTPGPEVEPWTLRSFMRRHPWWSVAIGLVVLSAILTRGAGTRPSYDAYGWIVWGYQTLHLTLDLGGAPSWKPLSFLFTVPFALFGHYELWLWMFTAVFVALAGPIFAGRIAYRMTLGTPSGTDSDRRLRTYAAWAAAVIAGCGVLGLEDYMHYILSVQSDPMIVTFCLAAIDMHLSGHERWAILFGLLAALGRPEAWPFFGLYSLWLWFRRPSTRWLVGGSWVVIVFMWFGIPTITNGRPLISGQLAKLSPRALHSNKIVGTIDRFTELQYLPIWIAALCTAAIGVLRRNRLVLGLAAGAILWVIVETAFALHGWPALPRYMFEPAAIAAVFAGVLVGWALIEAPRLRQGLPRWAGIPVVAVLVATLVPGALARLHTERVDLSHEKARTAEIGMLQKDLTLLGGFQHIRNCGEPVTDVEFVSALAWFTKLDVGQVGHRPSYELSLSHPIVMFVPVPNGWLSYPHHTRPYQVARCQNTNAAYVVLHHHSAPALLHGRG